MSTRFTNSQRYRRVIGGLAASGVLGVLTAGLATLANPLPAGAADVSISMQGFPNPQFCVNGDCSKHSVTITEGQTVTWNYQDTGCDVFAPCPGHTATYPGPTPDTIESPTMRDTLPLVHPGPYQTSYAFTFTRTGTYNYYCAYHGKSQTAGVLNMDGVVVVKPTVAGATDGSTGGSGSNPNGSTTAAFSDRLPNTYVPGLPSAGQPGAAAAGRAEALPVILVAVAMMAAVTTLVALWLRPAALPASR